MARTSEMMERLFERGRFALDAALKRQHKDVHIGKLYVITRADLEHHLDLVITYVTEGGALFVLDHQGQVVGQFGHFRMPGGG